MPQYSLIVDRCLTVRPFAIIILLMGLASGCTEEKPVTELPQEGDPLPTLVFSALTNSQLVSKDFAGKTVILNFWASWCAPCRKEMPSLDKLNNQLDRDKYRVIGVSVDEDKNIAREFLLQYEINFTNYHDEDSIVSKKTLGIKAFPETYIISPEGTIARIISGEQVWDSKGMIKLLHGISSGDASSTKSWSYGS